MKAKGVKWSQLWVRLFLEALQTTAETPQQKTHPKFLISMKKTYSVLLFYFDKNIYILENSKQRAHAMHVEVETNKTEARQTNKPGRPRLRPFTDA